MRSWVRESMFPANDSDLNRILSEALGEQLEPPDPLSPGELLEVNSQNWLWEGVIRYGCANLVVSPPKVGKSALMVALCAALLRGETSYMGASLRCSINKLIIVGTDQDETDWWVLLRREGLGRVHVTPDGDEQNVLCDGVKLWSQRHGMQLNPKGIKKIAQVAADNPGSVVLVDTLYACTMSLGVEEASPEISKAVKELETSLVGTGSTLVVLHHTNKSVMGGNWIGACRGNNALPGAVSFGVLMNWLRVPAEGGVQTDRRIAILPGGRGKAASLVVELTDDGWVSHGAGEEAIAISARDERELQLVGTDAKVFDYIKQRFDTATASSSTSEISKELNIHSTTAGRCCRKLQSSGLISQDDVTVPGFAGGRPSALWLPAGCSSSRGTTKEGVINPPAPSHTYISELLDKPLISYVREGKEGGLSNGSPKARSEGEGVLTPDEAPSIAQKVQRSVLGEWEEGRIFVISEIHSLDRITINPLGQSNLRTCNQRWMLDIRPISAHPPDEGKAILEANEPF